VDALDTGSASATEGDSQISVCRTRIRFANVGGASTDLTSVSTLVRFGDKSAELLVTDYTSPAWIGDMMLTTHVWTDKPSSPLEVIKGADVGALRPPLSVAEHTTIQVFVDLAIKSDPGQYQLERHYYRTRPADPTAPDQFLDSPNISVEYSLEFSDSSPVTTPSLVCFFVK